MSIQNEPPDDPFDCPERKLMRYLLIDAVERWREGKKEANRWIFLYNNPRYYFCFENVCRVLDIDADYLRGQLLEERRLIGDRFFGKSVSAMAKKW